MSFCLFNLYTQHIMRNARLGEFQAGIETDRRNINNLRYTDTILMAEREEELKNLLMRVKEKSEKASLKLNIEKTKIMASHSITSWQSKEEKVEVVTDFLFLGSKSLRIVTAAMKSEMFASWQESYDKPRQHAEKQRHYSADKSLYSQVYGLFSSS